MKILSKLSLISLLTLCLMISKSALAEIAVVVSASNNNAVSQSEIKRIFLGKLKKFPDGSSVTPINQNAELDLRKAFDEIALGKSASQIKSYWAKEIFSGKGNPPKEVNSDQEVIAEVSSNPNAIGYVDAASVNGSVKVVATF
ncbi:phosphate ABC transporter substrate-binding protein [Paraneptunicella aestuarii]|uniref:phosphate ABC transporter substrate-binding protein n=1 Tax=Paraneptunicella aestuarii TaxID=2831148 RepID=UPI001E36B69B|nr:phosphate ABC transporter substrate-binding protein [Paraneptunicella aestuarii]UAA40238.1 phosphate ABC transporter substrate-binding protein [Paraneptunicella aestuarii]